MQGRNRDADVENGLAATVGEGEGNTDACIHTTTWTKEARIYNGGKTISLTSGAGKTGQPLVKE